MPHAAEVAPDVFRISVLRQRSMTIKQWGGINKKKTGRTLGGRTGTSKPRLSSPSIRSSTASGPLPIRQSALLWFH
jgi:hypothetical protein